MDGGTIDEGCEEHVWVGRNHTDDVGGAQPFHNAGIQVGDTVSFEGDVFLYRRRDKTFDYAIENCRNIVKIQPYSLPTQEQLLEQELGHLVCETCLYSSQCYGEPCLAPEGYREQAIKNLKEILQEDNERHSAYPNDKDRQYMDGLRSAVMKHIERTIAKARDDEPREEECERFYRYVESIMTSPAVGEWWFIKEDIPDYPFSPVYGTVFVFEYEGETAYYGWDADRGEIGFYSLPKHLELSQKEFILMEDILNEPIGVSTT